MIWVRLQFLETWASPSVSTCLPWASSHRLLHRPTPAGVRWTTRLDHMEFCFVKSIVRFPWVLTGSMVSCCWILGGISRSDEGGAWSELRVQRVQPAAARGADRRGVRGSSEPAAQAHGCGWDGETVITSPDSHCEMWCFKVRDRNETSFVSQLRTGYYCPVVDQTVLI